MSSNSTAKCSPVRVRQHFGPNFLLSLQEKVVAVPQGEGGYDLVTVCNGVAILATGDLYFIKATGVLGPTVNAEGVEKTFSEFASANVQGCSRGKPEFLQAALSAQQQQSRLRQCVLLEMLRPKQNVTPVLSHKPNNNGMSGSSTVAARQPIQPHQNNRPYWMKPLSVPGES